MTPLAFSRGQMVREASLTDADRAEVAKCRRDHNRLGFAYQVGFVRLFHRFPAQQPLEMCDELVEAIVNAHASNDKDPPDWEWKEIEDGFFKQFKYRPNLRESVNLDEINSPDDLIEIAIAGVKQLYEQREAEFTEPVMRQIEKVVMLQTLDSLWKDHLLAMDHLKEGIGLRGYGQKNPLVEYQKEGFEMFESMMRVTRQDVVEKVFSVQVRREQDVEQIQQQQQRPQKVVMSHGEETVDQSAATVKREADKVGRNDVCPCGSGKKYKRCHGK